MGTIIDPNSIAERPVPMNVFISDIIGAMAKFAVQQHPYRDPPMLDVVIHQLLKHSYNSADTNIKSHGFRSHKFYKWQECEKWLREALTPVEYILRAWNMPRAYTSINHIVHKNADFVEPDARKDFIDIDALIRNVCNEVITIAEHYQNPDGN